MEKIRIEVFMSDTESREYHAQLATDCRYWEFGISPESAAYRLAQRLIDYNDQTATELEDFEVILTGWMQPHHT